jgi:hypothetical protein
MFSNNAAFPLYGLRKVNTSSESMHCQTNYMKEEVNNLFILNNKHNPEEDMID